MSAPFEVKSCCVSGREFLPPLHAVAPPRGSDSEGLGLSSPTQAHPDPSSDIHSGTPKGTVSNVYSLPTYIATPEGGSKAKTAVFLTCVLLLLPCALGTVDVHWRASPDYALLLSQRHLRL